MEGKTEVYRVVVVLDDGNHNALVFRKPVQGLTYERGQLVAILDNGSTTFVANDDGVIPHREPSSPGEDLGLTWHFAK